MFRDHSGIMIYGPLGEAAQGFLVKPLCQRVNRNQATRIQEITLFGELMTAHIELNFVAKALLHTGNDQQCPLFELFL